MKLLLDTHAFIWWHSDPAQMSTRALQMCKDPANTVLLSVATVWEMQVKAQLGKLKLDLPLAELVETECQLNDLTVLPVLLDHVLALEALPGHHRDPFDRILIAQAIVANAHLVTHDSAFEHYPVRLAW